MTDPARSGMLLGLGGRLVIGLLVTSYLLRSVKRLAAEAQGPAPSQPA